MKTAATQLTVCLVLSACGGGGSGARPPPPAVCGPADDTVFSGTQLISVRPEVEPNDDISMANGVTIPTPAQPEDRVVIQIIGDVTDAVDGADNFSFTSSRTKRFFFRLCEAPAPAPLPLPSCNYDPGKRFDRELCGDMR
jgi:hypothetical protein